MSGEVKARGMEDSTTNFDAYLKELLMDTAFAERFRLASAEWDAALQVHASPQRKKEIALETDDTAHRKKTSE